MKEIGNFKGFSRRKGKGINFTFIILNFFQTINLRQVDFLIESFAEQSKDQNTTTDVSRIFGWRHGVFACSLEERWQRKKYDFPANQEEKNHSLKRSHVSTDSTPQLNLIHLIYTSLHALGENHCD